MLDWKSLHKTINGATKILLSTHENPDGDGLGSNYEQQIGTDPDDDDSDDDGLSDGVETNTEIWVSSNDTGTDPLNADSDDDEVGDGAETRPFPVGPRLPETGKPHHNQPRVYLVQVAGAQVPAFHHAGPESFDKKVRLLDQLTQ